MFETIKHLKSDLNNIAELEDLSQKIVHDNSIAVKFYASILISLTEAVSNAIVHGNEENAEKDVTIAVNTEDKVLAIRVSDEGIGFDYRAIPDPTTPENVVKSGGRGIFLIRELTDKMIFLNEGSTIELHFNCL